MTPTAEKWADRARYDLETARAMMVSGRYLYVLFCCQQTGGPYLKCPETPWDVAGLPGAP